MKLGPRALLLLQNQRDTFVPQSQRKGSQVDITGLSDVTQEPTL